MTLEEFKEIDASVIPVGHYISMIFRGQTQYLYHKLKKLDINPSQLHFLLEIKHNEEINQDKIASKCNMNKGSVARSIRKLEEKDLVLRKIDDNNRRQNIISLTPKGEETLRESIEILEKWESRVLKENEAIDEDSLKKMLKEITEKTIEINKDL